MEDAYGTTPSSRYLALPFTSGTPVQNPTGGTMWIGFSVLIAWVFPGIILWGFPPTSKTETSLIVFSMGFLASIVI